MFKIIFLMCCFLVQCLTAEAAIIVGIAGGTASGKTTLANQIQAVFSENSVIISQDAYYKSLSSLPPEERIKTNFDHTSDDIRILRRAVRDIGERSRDLKSVQEQYLKTVKPMHDLFVEPSKQYADLIILGDRQQPIAFDMIISKLNHDLKL